LQEPLPVSDRAPRLREATEQRSSHGTTSKILFKGIAVKVP
jgi:hypothetical protein